MVSFESFHAGGFMRFAGKKFVVLFFTFVFGVALLRAGDVANLLSLGFSDDGKLYAFGEYGILDKTYQAYANMYIVDVAKNAYIKGGVFKTSPSALTVKKDSRSIFLALQNRASSVLSKNKISEKNEGRPIYAQSEKTKTSSEFEFRDFETNYTYTVILHKQNRKLDAAFYISFTAIAPDGSKKNYSLGNKDYFRSGVKDYNIKRILINQNNDALVFVIEKVIRDKSGDCIRYMVETITL